MEIDGKICVITGGASGIGLGPKAHAAALDVRSTESFEVLAAHAPYTPDAEKYNVQAIIRQLISEKD